MKKVIDISQYKNQLYLELCLSMVEDAYLHSIKGENDLTKAQLEDILETFDRMHEVSAVESSENASIIAEVIPFPRR